MYDIGYKVVLTSALFLVIFFFVGVAATAHPKQPRVADHSAWVVIISFIGLLSGFLMMIWGK